MVKLGLKFVELHCASPVRHCARPGSHTGDRHSAGDLHASQLPVNLALRASPLSIRLPGCFSPRPLSSSFELAPSRHEQSLLPAFFRPNPPPSPRFLAPEPPSPNPTRTLPHLEPDCIVPRPDQAPNRRPPLPSSPKLRPRRRSPTSSHPPPKSSPQ